MPSAEYMREYRARKRAESSGASVTDIRKARDRKLSVFDFVQDELDTISGDRKRKGDVAIALAMAQILDDPGASQRPQAAQRLAEALERMRGGSTEVKGKLAILQELKEVQSAAGENNA